MNDLLLDRLSDADPAADLPGYDDATSADVVATILAGDDELAPRRAPRRARRWASLGLAAAVAAGLVAVPVGLQMRDDDGTQVTGLTTHPAGASAAAAELLGKAADVTPKDPPTRPGQYWKITQVRRHRTGEGRAGASGGIERSLWLVTDTTTSYIPVGGTGPRYTVDDQGRNATYVMGYRDFTPSAGTLYERTDPSPEESAGSWLHPTVRFFAALPRDPQALNRRLHTWDGDGHDDPFAPPGTYPGPTDDRSGDDDAYGKAMLILSDGQAPADLRAATLRMLRLVPGVTITDGSARVRGRAGVAIGRVGDAHADTGREREEIVLDPTDGTVLATRLDQATEGPDAAYAQGTVYDESTFTREVVDAVPTWLTKKAAVS